MRPALRVLTETSVQASRDPDIAAEVRGYLLGFRVQLRESAAQPPSSPTQHPSVAVVVDTAPAEFAPVEATPPAVDPPPSEPIAVIPDRPAEPSKPRAGACEPLLKEGEPAGPSARQLQRGEAQARKVEAAETRGGQPAAGEHTPLHRTVRAHIGGGGMADVFQATDEELGVFVEVLDERSSRNLPARANTPGGPSVGWPGLRGSSGRAGRK